MDAWSASRYTGPRKWLIFLMVLLMLVMVQFFRLVPLLPLSEGNMSFATFFVIALFILIKAGPNKNRLRLRQMRPLMWFMFGILLSFIPAYIYYTQDPFQSILTYRKFLCYLTLPLLLVVNPTNDEIRRAFTIFSVLWLVMTVLVTFYMQAWVDIGDGLLFVEEGDILHTLPGGRLVCLSFIFTLDHYLHNKTTENLLMSILMFLCVFIMFSRTILIAALAVILLATVSGRTISSKMTGVAVSILFFAIFTYLAMDRLGMFIEETTTQLGDVEYNRNKALIYMFASQRDFWTILLGNGYISGHVSEIVYELQEQGIFHSDVGLVGMWHQFGLISIIVILFYAFKGLSRDYSFVVRGTAVFILVSSATIGYFAVLECIFWMSLYWFLLVRESETVKLERERRRYERMIRMQKYRSISS